ncbi:heparinase II/III family protein [Alphaproteobacteria bacterium]|nr:heparinase II/III family protein [Alphaproteobacteria bacterium]
MGRLAKIFSTASIYLRTLRYLKIKQVIFRLRYYISRPAALPLAQCDIHIPRNIGRRFQFPAKGKTIYKENEFCFLNKTEVLSFPEGWNKNSIPILWLYNLHYFDGILNTEISDNTTRALINRWITDNPPGYGVGWQPYPLSLRICNWIKWIWRKDVSPNKMITSSLFQQTHYLSRTLEYHLLGNHLLENAKALIFSGFFFGGPKGKEWLVLGTQILRSELEEQVLDDGCHFELSPMYHIIILELVLDILQLCNDSNPADELSDIKTFLIEVVKKMSVWLTEVCHPDGEIPYFNDAAFGIAPSPADILTRSSELAGFRRYDDQSRIKHFSDSGFVRFQDKESFLIMDLGEVGASYLAGHGHADSLSLELSVLGQRVIVNSGTSEYGNTARRSYERSTAAHSTLELNSENSSEVWGGFRVGRRASVGGILFGNDDTVTASHNGYRFLNGSPLHVRKVAVKHRFISIEDSVQGPYKEARAYYHIHPSVQLVQKNKLSGVLILPSNKLVEWVAVASRVYIQKDYYAAGFGLLEPSFSLILIPNHNDVCKLQLAWG